MRPEGSGGAAVQFRAQPCISSRAADAMEPKAPATETTPDEVLLAFAERYLADQDAGRGVQLADYLRLWPEHQVAVAREYLAARRQADGDTGEAADGDGTFGPFRIEREIGRGGQGAVYLAEDTRLHRKVALKVILRLGQDAGAQLRRFRREAEVASRLELRGICGVHEVGMEDGVPFIAMPYLEGETLAARIERLRAAGAGVGRDEVLATLRLFEQLARILHRAHGAGILHRDLKPANIMLTPGGEPVIFDFGLASLLDTPGAAALTQSGDLLGTPTYMAPEQIGGRVQPDRRTDVYSLGISLYESLTLQKPFAATTREALFHAILSQQPADPRQCNRAVPADLGAVLEMAVEKDRDRRYQSAADFAEDLRAVREGRPTMARRIGPFGRLVRWSRREPAKAALVGALLVALPTIAALVTARLKDLPHVEAAQRALAEEHREALLHEATDELTEGDAQVASRLFASALQVPGPAGEAAGGLILARLRLHDPAGAIALLDEHRQHLGTGAAAFALRAEALRAQGREPEAAQLLQGAPAAATALDHQLLATQALRGCEHGTPDDFRLALAHATAAILLAKQPYLLHYELRLHAAGHLLAREPIVETVAAMAHRWPASARARFRCGWALKMLEDPALLDQAIAHLQAAIALQPTHAGACNILGNCLTAQGRHDAAVAAFADSLRLQPGRAPTHVNLALAWLRAGQPQRAVECCRRALELGGEDGRAHAVLGNCQEALGEPALAMASYREALRLLPGEPAARENLARLLADQGLRCDEAGRPGEAIAAYRESLQLHRTGETHNNLGKTLLGEQLAAEAEVELRQAVALLPQNADVHANLILALLQQQHVDEALAAAVQAVAETGAAKAHGWLGHILIAQERFEEAVEPCRMALRTEPELAPAKFDLGIALANAGDLEAAIAVWQEVVAADPDQGWVWHHLGLALCESERPERGLDALRRAHALASPEQRESLGLPALLAEVESRVAKRRRIRTALGSGAAPPAPQGTDQLLAHAAVALDEGRADLATRWYASAFAPATGDLLRHGAAHWHAAVTAALRAAQAQAGAEAAANRARARSWLRDGLRGLADRVGRSTAAELRRALLPLTTSPDLRALLAPPALDALPEPEREDWRTLCRELEQLVPPLRRFNGS